MTVKLTPITMEQYLRDQMTKVRNHLQHDNDFDTLVNAFPYANAIHLECSIETGKIEPEID